MGGKLHKNWSELNSRWPGIPFFPRRRRFTLGSLSSSVFDTWNATRRKRIFRVPGARFSKLPVITGPVKLFSIPDESFKGFDNYSVKLSAKKTKWTSFEVRTRSTFLEALISNDSGPVKLPGLSRNGPQDRFVSQIFILLISYGRKDT